MTIPDGLEPIAAWGPHTPHWVDSVINEKIAWAKAHIDRADDAYRAEFYMLDDKPVALVYRYARNAAGAKYQDPGTGEIAREKPAIQALDELPPERLLGR